MGRKKKKLYGRIPENINLDWILEGVDGNVTKIRYLRDGIVYFLNLISVDNTSKLIEFTDGYRHLNEEILSDVIGNGRPTQITRLLEQKEIIETIRHIKGVRSRGYRLTEEYNTGKFRKEMYSDRIQKKLEDYNTKKKVKYNKLKKNYDHIDEQFSKNDIKIQIEQSKQFVIKFGKKLFEKTIVLPQNQRGFTLKSLFNYIGWMDFQIENFNTIPEPGKVSETNLRYNSKITSLPKVLRPFLTINGKPVGEVDISSSQPFILSTILTESFTNDNSDGYNLHTIYPEFYVGLNNLKLVVPSNIPKNNNYLLGVWMTDSQLEGIKRFVEFQFNNDFYDHILKEGEKLNPKLVQKISKGGNGRENIKSNIMNYMFNRNDIQRESNQVIDLVNLIFPEVTNYIVKFNQSSGKSGFSYVLQRTESYLMLRNVCLRLSVENPEVPFFTIHDSILTTTDNLKLVKEVIFDTIHTITGKTFSLKIKELNGDLGLDNKMVNDYFNDKIKTISVKNHHKKRVFYLDSNVQKGLEILFPDPNEQKEWFDIMTEEINEQLNLNRTGT